MASYGRVCGVPGAGCRVLTVGDGHHAMPVLRAEPAEARRAVLVHPLAHGSPVRRFAGQQRRPIRNEVIRIKRSWIPRGLG